MSGGAARVVAGRYRLVRALGRGGMGTVWHAHDTLLGRDVAVKEVYLPDAGNDSVDVVDPVLRRALREAQAAAQLRHPGIITVHDVVSDEGRPWIVMELVGGRSLAQVIREQGVVSAWRTAQVGLRVLEALRVAHRHGVLHRDVKPANILLDEDRVVLTDFGIAAVDGATMLTATGQMVGSPGYLAPERINGRAATPAADLWGLGVTLYAAVAGRSPFQRDDTQATLAAVLTCHPDPPAHAGTLWPVIKGLLVKDPDQRLTAEQAAPLLAVAARPQTTAAGDSRRRWPAEDGTRTLAAPTAPQPQQGRPDQGRPDQGRPVQELPAPSTAEAAPTTVAAGTAAATTVAAGSPAATVPVDTSGQTTIAAGRGWRLRLGGLVRTGDPPVRRGRTPWIAALCVVILLLAGLAVWAVWSTTGRGADTGSGHGDRNHNGIAAGVADDGASSPAAPSPSSSPSALPVAAPQLDPCLVGRWRMTSIQVVNIAPHTRFTGPGGEVTRIWPDGRAIDDWNHVAPLTATFQGHRYEEVLRGKVSYHIETRDAKMLTSGSSGRLTYTLKKDGIVYDRGEPDPSQGIVPYSCSDTTLRTYGDEKHSTQSFTRVSRTP